MNIRKLSSIVIAVLAINILSIGGVAATAKTSVYKGILIDADCSSTKNPDKHSKECNLMPECAKSGYGIDIKQSNGTYKFYKFDTKGQKLAVSYLKTTKKKDSLTITVTGSLKGNTISVKTLKEDNTNSTSSKAINTKTDNVKATASPASSVSPEPTATPNATEKAEVKSLEYIGWIVDADCVGMNPINHKKGCNLMGGCYDSGLGIVVYDKALSPKDYSEKNYLYFDGESKKLAKKFLESLPADWGNNVTVKITSVKAEPIPASKTLVPETDSSKVTAKLEGLHITSIEAFSIEGVSTNKVPEGGAKLTQK